MEAFNDWFDHFHKGAPQRPLVAEGATFTERVAHEQREKQYRGEVERWRGGQVVQSRQAEERIRAVLAFPGGWLVEEEAGDDTMETADGDGEDGGRAGEMTALRRELLPRAVSLLHSLLHSTGQHAKCVALADTVADEGSTLYQAFSTAGLRDLLGKVRESALAALEQGRDAWGYARQ
jgi:nuclear pore complex protein Nup107